MKLLLLLLSLVLVPGDTWIQVQLPAGSAPPLADDDVSALVTGEFSGNTHVDAVVIAGGKPVLRDSVEIYQTYLEADLTVSDIARLEGTGAGGRDQLVAVGPSGLSLLEVHSVVPPASPWTITNLRPPGPFWANALAVRTGQVDGLFGDDIVAVTHNRVLVARSDGDGGWEMSDLVFIAGIGITGCELVDWDGAAGGALEVAVLIGRNSQGAAKTRLVRADGTFLQTINTSADALFASTLATESEGPRWLAVVATTHSAGEQELAILSSSALAGPWSLGEISVIDSVAADWDSNRDDDLVLGAKSSNHAVLYRTSRTVSNELTLHALTPPESPVLLPVGHPQRNCQVQDGRMDVADVDLDGDLDLVTAVQGTYTSSTWTFADPRFSSVDVTLNRSTQQEEWIPWHRSTLTWPEGLPLPELTASGTLVVPLLTPFRVIPDADYEYALWRTPSLASHAIPTAMFSGTAPIAPQVPEILSWTTVTFPVGQTDPLFPDRYTLIARQVRKIGGVIEEEGPALKVTFYSALHAEDIALDWTSVTIDLLRTSEPDQPGGNLSGPGLPPTAGGQQPGP